MCADQWDKQDADVACRMMDFDGALSADFEYEEETEIKGRPWLSNMNCTGNEKSLFSCFHGGFGFRDCKAKRKAGVTCKPRGKRIYNTALLTYTVKLKFPGIYVLKKILISHGLFLFEV